MNVKMDFKKSRKVTAQLDFRSRDKMSCFLKTSPKNLQILPLMMALHSSRVNALVQECIVWPRRLLKTRARFPRITKTSLFEYQRVATISCDATSSKSKSSTPSKAWLLII
nr:uncharacterized protein LOC119182169 isoform X2 [Rhipicephalus microplus]